MECICLTLEHPDWNFLGSKSDWNDENASDTLKEFGIPHVCRVSGAPYARETAAFVWVQEKMDGSDYRGQAERDLRGTAALTTLPGLGVPRKAHRSRSRFAVEHRTIPRAFRCDVCDREAGAVNAALFAVSLPGIETPRTA
jgi:phosphoribosylcarboxyaminoimidazole (NCAIR) mutase